MKHVVFGGSGIRVSEMCLGTMMFGRRCDEAEADRIVSAAFGAEVKEETGGGYPALRRELHLTT